MDQFEFMEPVGFISSLANHSKEKKDSTPFTDFYRRFVEAHPSLAQEADAFMRHKLVGYSEERQRIQEKKMDKLPVYPNDEVVKLAEEYTYRMYQSCLEARLTMEPSVHGSKSPAFPYTKAGFSTKAEAIISDFHKELMMSKPTPIWKDSAKGGEALPVEDLETGKLRTFSQVPLFFAVYQKFLFEDQNDRMKHNHKKTWGQYGWVKQYGGFNRMFREFEKFLTRVMADVSGWDRSVFLEAVYRLRTRGLFTANDWLRDSVQMRELIQYVVENTVRPITSFVDGSVWRRKTGNCSGSNNTTTDNTLAHSIVLFYFFIWRFHSVHGVMPEYEQIVNFTVAKLFGDDSAFSLDVDHFGFNSQEDLRLALVEAYSRFGLTLKEKAVFIDWLNPGKVTGIEFLGSTGEWSNKHGLYIARPRISKLAYSLACSNENDTLETEIQKAVTIWDLVSLVETPFERVVHNYCCFLYNYARDLHFEGVSRPFIASLERVIARRVDWSLVQGFE